METVSSKSSRISANEMQKFVRDLYIHFKIFKLRLN